MTPLGGKLKVFDDLTVDGFALLRKMSVACRSHRDMQLFADPNDPAGRILDLPHAFHRHKLILQKISEV